MVRPRILLTAVVLCVCATAQVQAQGTPLSPAASSVDPEAGGTEVVIVQEGEGWKVVNAHGWATDDGGQYFDQNLILMNGAGGAATVPLPDDVKTDALRDTETGDSTLVLDQATINEITASQQLGRLTPALLAVAEHEDVVDSFGDPHELFGRCSNGVITKSKTVDLGSPITLTSGNFGGGFSGLLTLNGNIQGTATGEIRLELKRFGIFGACIPYGVKFDHARAYGNLLAGYSATLSGTVNYANPNPWEWEIAKPFLFSFNFMIGPVPVHVGFNLPITAGLELSASLTGSVSYNAGQTAQGAFDYTCTFSNGCIGWANFNQTGGNSTQSLTGSVSGHIKPSVYAQAALRGYLYAEWLAYAQVGVRPYLHGDLWGYYGNNCGDADGDGSFETVDALTFDLDWQLRITAQASVFGLKPKRWDNIWSTPYRHIAFWDLLGKEGSRAVQPMLVAQSPVPVNTSQRYDAKMRPCWPYGETVSYGLSWGDGTSAALSGAPQSFTSTYKTWPTEGPKPIALTALSDGHGRELNATTHRTIEVTGGTGTWTVWLDRDDPSGTGDWETLVDFRAAGINVCNGAVPIGIECETLAGVDYRNAGEVYSCTASTGGICQNALQNDGACFDYQVRFLCQ
jgi:hypothetical protein